MKGARSRPVRLAALAVLLGLAALAARVALEPLPPALLEPPEVSLEVLDRSGRLVRDVRDGRGALSSRVRLPDVAPAVVPALLAAEDARFFRHPGVDPIAVVRALAQAAAHGHVVSGASTLTQQLARTVTPRPRTLRGKLHEAIVALRIEASLDKERILEEYLSRVEFGPNLRGIDAASRAYFDKPASDLDLSEAATLVAIPRGPTLYDPRRGLENVTRRRDRILERMRGFGLAPDDAVDRALGAPLRLQARRTVVGAEHLALALASGRGVPPSLAGSGPLRRVETTLDLDLEREVEVLARRTAASLEGRGVSALAVLVVENATGEVLAHVGSPDYFAEDALGANDGVLALRQPGSTLKPFVYAAAMERLGMTAATVLPDVELVIPTPDGPYRPRNYDGLFHGPVRLREALASSLNVPAVYTAERASPGVVLDVLRRFGFASLSEGAAHYGAAIALGDGEVRLAELAEAYSTLARGGERLPLATVRAAVTASGRRVEVERREPVRIVDPRIAAALTDMLSDDAARAAAFGRDGALAFPFPVAAKTGTSKGYRDNWTVGYTREVTVAVWAGNFDGSPMRGSTGITGAAPLFHDVMMASMRGRTAAAFESGALVTVEVCALSGELPGPGCTHRHREVFVPGSVPSARCSFHVPVIVDAANGLLSRLGCPGAEERTLEVLPPAFGAWAANAGRPGAPTRASPRCPGAGDDPTARVVKITYPRPGARFLLDPTGPARQEVVFAAEAGGLAGSVRFVLDGRPLAAAGAPFEVPWVLAPGRHLLEAFGANGLTAAPVRFEVERAF